MARARARQGQGRGRAQAAAAPAPARPAARLLRRPAVRLAAAALGLLALLAVARSCLLDRGQIDAGEAAAPAERLRVRVIRRHPHQRDAFTQGLVWHEGQLYESTGTRGQSSLRLVELATGEVLRRRDLDPELFGEGLALAGDLLYQLTWQEHRALVYRRDDFEPVREHRYEGEGWGLCFDGESLVMSDGTDRLSFRDPASFAVRRTVRVRLDGRPLPQLNELECVEGAVWANVWTNQRIVQIDPHTGHVTAIADARGLLAPEDRRGTDVLNGIAWMPESGHFLLTGKNWPWLFEVVFEPARR